MATFITFHKRKTTFKREAVMNTWCSGLSTPSFHHRNVVLSSAHNNNARTVMAKTKDVFLHFPKMCPN